jgi:hypothetical protein
MSDEAKQEPQEAPPPQDEPAPIGTETVISEEPDTAPKPLAGDHIEPIGMDIVLRGEDPPTADTAIRFEAEDRDPPPPPDSGDPEPIGTEQVVEGDRGDRGDG